MTVTFSHRHGIRDGHALGIRQRELQIPAEVKGSLIPHPRIFSSELSPYPMVQDGYLDNPYPEISDRQRPILFQAERVLLGKILFMACGRRAKEVLEGLSGSEGARHHMPLDPVGIAVGYRLSFRIDIEIKIVGLLTDCVLAFIKYHHQKPLVGKPWLEPFRQVEIPRVKILRMGYIEANATGKGFHGRSVARGKSHPKRNTAVHKHWDTVRRGPGNRIK